MPFALKRTITLVMILIAGCGLLAAEGSRAEASQTAVPAAPRAAAPPPAAQDPGSVLQLAARQYNLPVEALTVVNSAPGRDPEIGQIVQRYKVMDSRDGSLYPLVLDESGRVVDPSVQTQAAGPSLQATGGKLEPALAATVAQAPAEEAIPVILWLKESGYAPPERQSPDAVLPEGANDAYLKMVDTVRAGAVAAVTAPVAGRLSQMGLSVSADVYAPVVYTTMTPAQIQQAAGWAEVDTIYLDIPNEPELESVFPTVGADVVFSRRIIGRGVKIGLVEVGGRADPENPYLKYYNQDTTDTCPAGSNIYLNHTTGVLGIFFSSHPTRTGLAVGAEPWVGGACDGSSSKMQARSTEAVNWGARILNLSWGADIGLTPGVNDKFYDNLWYTRYRVVVKSSGNASTGHITSPGLAYNVITVGNFDDEDTPNWNDDTMNPSSSWMESDASHQNDREKPEVVAPGTNINSTTPDNPATPEQEWTGSVGSGSSYSAPVVTGIAAEIMQRKITLQQWPEIVKAIIITSAIHNLEGDARLSEHDGAGGVSAEHADNIARGFGAGSGGKDSYNCSTIPAVETIATVTLGTGRLVRATIVWDQDSAYANYTTLVGADLDLVVLDPGGRVLTGSYSQDNTYEIVQFTPTVAGQYKLQIHKSRCDANPAFLGWAWMQIPYQVFSPTVLGAP